MRDELHVTLRAALINPAEFASQGLNIKSVVPVLSEWLNPPSAVLWVRICSVMLQFLAVAVGGEPLALQREMCSRELCKQAQKKGGAIFIPDDLLIFKCITSYTWDISRELFRTCLCAGLCQECGTKRNCMEPQAEFPGCQCLFFHCLGISDFGLSCGRCGWFQGGLQALVPAVVMMKSLWWALPAAWGAGSASLQPVALLSATATFWNSVSRKCLSFPECARCLALADLQ